MLFAKKTLSDIDTKDARVLVRVDYNVPLENGKIADDFRIQQSLATIEALLEQRCSVVLIAHLGRPKGKVTTEFSLRPVAKHLSKLLKQPVQFVDDCVGEKAVRAAQALQGGEVLMVENLRFHIEETINDDAFAKKLAQLGDVFVQDAFGVVHRSHASTDAITQHLPAVAGLLLENEVRELTRAVKHPKKPLVAIVGGAKIKTKIELLDNLMSVADRFIIGGAMSNTFLVAMGMEVGKSLYDEDEIEVAKQVIQQCKEHDTQLLLPLLDVAVASKVEASAKRRVVATEDVKKGDIILDFGPKSTASVLENLSDAGEVVWNGPLGMIELAAFKQGSEEVARYIVDNKIESVGGGGDTVELIDELDLRSGFSHVSTGGGAALELMSGSPLPGVEALLDKRA